MPPRKLNGSPKKAGTKAGRPNKAKRILKIPSIVKLKLKPPNATAADQIVGSEVNKVLDVEEADKPVIKNKVIAKRKYIKKKKVSEEQKVTKKGSPVKKKVKANGVAKSEETLEAKGASQENTECDIPKINKDFYKILLANQVVHAQFSNKPKYINEQPIDQVLKENKTTVKTNSNLVLKKKVATKKPVKTKKSGQPRVKKGKTCKECMCIQSKEVENNTDNTKNTEISTKPKKLTKRVRKITTSEKSCCKPDPNPKDGPNNTENTVTIDTKNAAQPPKRKSKLSLKRKTENAGPETKKILKGVQKARKMIDSKKLIKNEMKDKKITMVTDKSIENVNIDKNVDNNIEQASLASSSKSWTRHISSSSNSSFITVYSNGLHCFDNKIPVLKLRKINKKRIKEEKTVDRIDASLGLKRRLSRTSSSSSNQTNLNLEHNKVENNCEVTDLANVTCSSIRLSTSSTSSSSSSTSSSSSSSESSSISDTRQNVNSELKAVFEKLNSVLKICDFNKIKLSKNAYQIANESSFVTNVALIRDKILKNDVLKEETELCCFCDSVAKLEIEDVDKYFNQGKVQKTTEITCPKTPETFYSQDSQIINEHVNRSDESCKQNSSNSQQYSPAKEVDAVVANEIEEKIDGKYNKSNTSFVDNDDDDALSLFAESLTGLESCRRSSAFNSEMANSEEYVPQPVTHIEPRMQINYRPTKISNNIQYEIPDFTSLNKKQIEPPIPSLMDLSITSNALENDMIYEDRAGSFTEGLPKSTNIVNKITQESNRPRLMALNHRPVNGLKSSIFKGYCFFHIISICKKLEKCTFTHVIPTVSDVKNTLERLSEDSFIQEYMLVRNLPQLRRKYGLCFMEECIRRDLTRILVEIAIDFVIRCSQNSAEDKALKSEIVDNVLMYLNKVDLSICDDLLQYIIKYTDNLLLCDYFMSVIAMSQNFSRFKSVFINLTNFMYENDRTFSVDVAESILERLCILPYDDLLARAFLSILKKTDVTVFSNAKMPDLERLLQTSNRDLYNELKLLKDQALVSQPVLGNHHTYESLRNMDNIQINTNFGHADRNLIRYSPDPTCTLGTAIKSPIETVFKRTVNIQNLQQAGIGSKSNTQDVGKPSMNWKKPDVLRIGKNDNTNRKATDNTNRKATDNTNRKATDTVANGKVAKQSFKVWENRSIFDNVYMKNKLNVSLPCRQRQPFKRHSDWSFEGSPTKFKRKGGPSYFQRDL